jgi:hypothetical protein
MSRRRLNTDHISSELTQSVFFGNQNPQNGDPQEQVEIPHKKANKRTNTQTNERSDVQKYKRSNVQDYRTIIRRSYDVYMDQVDKIDEQVIKRRRVVGKNVTKGEVLREIIDYFFEKNP